MKSVVLRWWPILPAIAIAVAVAGRDPAPEPEPRPATNTRRTSTLQRAPAIPEPVIPAPERAPSRSVRRREASPGLQAVDAALGRDERIARLKDVLRGKDLPLKSRVFPYLRAIGGPEAVALAADVLQGEGPPWLRARAADLLGELGLPTAFPALLEATRSEDLVVRASAAAALDRLGQPAPLWELIGTLSERLDDPDVAKRAEAVDILIGMPSRAAWPVLVKALGDPADSRLREAAADALGRTRLAEAVPFLEKALRDPEAGVRRAAERALGTIRTP